MSLLDECIEALGASAIICKKSVTAEILNKFDKDYPLTFWGRINWDEVEKKVQTFSVEEISKILKENNKIFSSVVYIIGSDPKIPILECKLDKILEFFDDVTAVSPNTWLYNPSARWVIEVYHDGEITIGFREGKKVR